MRNCGNNFNTVTTIFSCWKRNSGSKQAQQFAASSERHTDQIALFDEAELEAALEALETQLPEDVPATSSSPKKTTRQRGFSDSLLRERVELRLSEQEKAGARATFFSKVKEELAFIPAQLKVHRILAGKSGV